MSEKFGEVDEGNIAELKQGDILFSYSHDTWTNEDVDVTLSLSETVENKENYRLEYSKDNRTWTRYNESTPITMTQNGKVYARVKDITGDIKTEGGYAKGEVTIIDKKVPTPGSITMKMASLGTPYVEGTEVYQNVAIELIDGQDEEGGSGIKSTTYSVTGVPDITELKEKTILKARDENYMITTNITTQDNAGNTVTIQKEYTIRTIYAKETKNLQAEDDTYYLPEGFKLAEDSATAVSDGIVIEDKNGNQWVWIPCYLEGGVNESEATAKKLVKYDRYVFTGQSGSSNGYIYDDNKTNYKGFSEARITQDDNSIKKYGGYYIGRFEAGAESGAYVLKKDKPINAKVSFTQANSAANTWSTNNNYSNGVYTKLCSSFAFDTALKFIDKSYPTFSADSKKNGIVVGNYSSVYTNTGLTESVCNIYDLGGNWWEFSSERNQAPWAQYACRGGSNKTDTNIVSPSARNRATGDGTSDDVTFRPTLYIK